MAGRRRGLALQPRGRRGDHDAGVAVADQQHVARLLGIDRRQHVLHVHGEIDAGRAQVGPVATAGERHRVRLASRRPQRRPHPLPHPRTAPGAVHQHDRLHRCVSRSGKRASRSYSAARDIFSSFAVATRLPPVARSAAAMAARSTSATWSDSGRIGSAPGGAAAAGGGAAQAAAQAASAADKIDERTQKSWDRGVKMLKDVADIAKLKYFEGSLPSLRDVMSAMADFDKWAQLPPHRERSPLPAFVQPQPIDDRRGAPAVVPSPRATAPQQHSASDVLSERSKRPPISFGKDK